MTHSLTSLVLTKTRFFIAVSTAALLLTACGSNDSELKTETSELEISTTEVIDNTIIPAANRFHQQAETLIDLSNSFCTDTNSMTRTNLLTVQGQWQATNTAWFELLPFRFGPMVNSELLPTYTFIDSYRLRGTNYIETVRTKVDTLLASTDTINAELFAGATFQFVGLLPLEVTLFEDAANQSSDTVDIVDEFIDQPRKCDVLIGYATELTRRADIIKQGWTTNYRGTGTSYRNLLSDGLLDTVLNNETGDTAVEEITVSVQEFYDYIANRNITTDVAQLSESIWQVLDNSLNITEELLQGTDSTTVSLNSIMNNNRFEQTVINIQENIKTMRSALEEENNTDMVAAAAILDGNFKRDLSTALNIELGLNFSDGD
ncbi:MAG: putative lipoprotein [Oleiphilaceae bacterium]|jgi:predicted lipoprotein